MFAVLDEAPTSTSLLMQCGYRSKVCTSPRATKIDGTLHNLCEFHRRKANFNQQRLHKRHRDERVARRRAEAAAESRPAKKAHQDVFVQIPIDPTPYSFTDALFDVGAAYDHSYLDNKLVPGALASEDMELLDLLLFDAQTVETFVVPKAPNAVDGVDSIVV